MKRIVVAFAVLVTAITAFGQKNNKKTIPK